MNGIRVRPLPDSSAILAGRGPVDPEVGEISSRLQIWYCNSAESWSDAREHAHRDADECFIVVKGTIVVEAEGVERTVGPREFCVFGRGVFHRVVRAIPPVEALVIRAPAADDKVYRDASTR